MTEEIFPNEEKIKLNNIIDKIQESLKNNNYSSLIKKIDNLTNFLTTNKSIFVKIKKSLLKLNSMNDLFLNFDINKNEIDNFLKKYNAIIAEESILSVYHNQTYDGDINIYCFDVNTSYELIKKNLYESTLVKNGYLDSECFAINDIFTYKFINPENLTTINFYMTVYSKDIFFDNLNLSLLKIYYNGDEINTYHSLSSNSQDIIKDFKLFSKKIGYSTTSEFDEEVIKNYKKNGFVIYKSKEEALKTI
jgi:hypothetical protein